MLKTLAAALATAIVLVVAAAPASAKDGRKGALIGGLAVGAVGGLLLGKALSDKDQVIEPEAAPAPRYVRPRPPAPEMEEDVEVARPVAVNRDPSFRKARQLRMACEDGDRRSCIRFGIVIGQNREREAQWRRQNPDMFTWDRAGY